MNLTINVDRRTLALVGAVLSAGVVTAATAAANILATGELTFTTADGAKIAAAGITGAIAAYAETAKATTR